MHDLRLKNLKALTVSVNAGLAALLIASAGLSTTANAQQSGAVVVARDMDINSLDPLRAFCDTCQIYLSSVYGRLVDLGPDGKTIVPMIAKNFTSSEDQKTFTFEIDPAATFSDGTPVEAKDVKWSFERLKNGKADSAYLIDTISSIETPDDKTVVINLSSPNSEFLAILTAPYLGIVNSDVVAEHGGDASADASTKDTAEQWLLANSAGAGPFVLSSYRPNEELRLKKNDAYWLAKPHVDEIVLTQSKEAVSRLQLAGSGNADVAMQIDPTTAESIADPSLKVDVKPSLNMIYIALSPGAERLPVPLSDKIRAAVGHAIDYDGVIDLTVAGKGRRLATVIPENFPGGGGVEPVAYDVEKAKQLMAEAGITQPIKLEAVYPNVTQYGVDFSIMMQKIQQDLSEIGIELDLQPVEFTVWRERINSVGIPVTAMFWVPDYPGSSQYAQYFTMTEGSVWYRRSGAEKAPSLATPQATGLLEEALASAGAQQDAKFRELAELVASQNIILPVLSADDVLVYKDGIKGLRISNCCNLVLSEISR